MLTIDDLARGLSDKQQIDAIILDVPKPSTVSPTNG